MRQFNKFKGTKGFISLWNRMIRFRYMITEQAKERCRVLAFWDKHGTEAAKEAFNVSERSLFRWQKALKQTNGNLEGLNKKKTAPKNKRLRSVPEDIKNAIIQIRQGNKIRLGKEKVWKILRDDYGYQGSVSTVGRIISDLKKKGLLQSPVKLSYYARTGRFIERKARKTKKIRRPKEYTECLEVDTIIRFVDGTLLNLLFLGAVFFLFKPSRFPFVCLRAFCQRKRERSETLNASLAASVPCLSQKARTRHLSLACSVIIYRNLIIRFHRDINPLVPLNLLNWRIFVLV